MMPPPPNAAAAAAANMPPLELLDVGAFLVQSSVDQSASDLLLGCTHEEQQHVMRKGTLEGGRNPSALLASRIRDTKQELAETGGAGGATMMAQPQPPSQGFPAAVTNA